MTGVVHGLTPSTSDKLGLLRKVVGGGAAPPIFHDSADGLFQFLHGMLFHEKPLNGLTIRIDYRSLIQRCRKK